MGWCSATPTNKSSTMHELNVEFMNINAVNTETELNIQMHGKHDPIRLRSGWVFLFGPALRCLFYELYRLVWVPFSTHHKTTNCAKFHLSNHLCGGLVFADLCNKNCLII